jgi:acyl-coenzyme A synthetase/AMP-(fatty) acid ligase
MWNFLISGLGVGCTLVLYDGSPLRDPSYLWRLTDELKITIYGTSAKYIDQLAVSLSLECRTSHWTRIIVDLIESV